MAADPKKGTEKMGKEKINLEDLDNVTGGTHIHKNGIDIDNGIDSSGTIHDSVTINQPTSKNPATGVFHFETPSAPNDKSDDFKMPPMDGTPIP